MLTALERASEQGEPVMRLSQVATATGLPLTTTHRICTDLVAQGFIDRAGHGLQLGTRLFELGEHVPRKRRVRDAALPYMQDLYEVTHHTVHLGVLDGTDMLYVDKISGHQPAKSPSRVGSRFPATCTALGKALLAWSDDDVIDTVIAAGLPRKTPYSITDPNVLRSALATIAGDGYAVEREEAAIGIGCVAAPILDGSHRPVAAISLTMRLADLDLGRLGPLVRTSGRSISRVLGGP